MYKLGTLEQFNTEDLLAKQAAGWTQSEIANGKIINDGDNGYIITSVINKIQKPDTDLYIWSNDNGDLTENDKYNLLCSWFKNIISPKSDKYYIEKKLDNSYNIGKLESGLTMICGKNSQSLKIFDSRQELEARAKKLKIDPMLNKDDKKISNSN